MDYVAQIHGIYVVNKRFFMDFISRNPEITTIITHNYEVSDVSPFS